ncbi:MAG: histidine kinase [Ginsengibacter sp.]
MVENILVCGILLILFLGCIHLNKISLKRKNENILKGKTPFALQQQATGLESRAHYAQMNPHFILNSINAINSLILKNETEAASDSLTKFSRLITLVSAHSRKPFITLDDELGMLTLYLDIERLHFENSFDYHINFIHPIDAYKIFIPPLLLQPFVENAIWQAFMHKEGRGSLDIKFSIENKTLICIITDNGIGREKTATLKSIPAEKEKSVGLRSTDSSAALRTRNVDEHTSFNFEDIKDDEGKAAGTRLILKIHYLQLNSGYNNMMKK